jgi:hypothetical protein
MFLRPCSYKHSLKLCLVSALLSRGITVVALASKCLANVLLPAVLACTGVQRLLDDSARVAVPEGNGGLMIQFVRFEVFTAVTMKNVVFGDINSQFVLHRKHITSPLHSPAG